MNHDVSLATVQLGYTAGYCHTAVVQLLSHIWLFVTPRTKACRTTEQTSASASVLPVNIQDWSPLGWTGWISLQSKGLSRVFSNNTVQKHRSFSGQSSLSHYLFCSHSSPSTCHVGCSRVRATSKTAAAAAKSLQSCQTLCDPIDGSPPGSPVPGILQARTLEWAAISFCTSKTGGLYISYSCVW